MKKLLFLLCLCVHTCFAAEQISRSVYDVQLGSSFSTATKTLQDRGFETFKNPYDDKLLVFRKPVLWGYDFDLGTLVNCNGYVGGISFIKEVEDTDAFESAMIFFLDKLSVYKDLESSTKEYQDGIAMFISDNKTVIKLMLTKNPLTLSLMYLDKNLITKYSNLLDN